MWKILVICRLIYLWTCDIIYKNTRGIFVMSSLYYPYYKLEDYKTKNKTYNHKLNINTLSLFCTDIVIPCRHILTISVAKYNTLLNSKKLFEQGVLYYRLPENIENLSDYYEKIKNELYRPNHKLIKSRIEELSNINQNVSHKYSSEIQQANYSDNIKRIIDVYVEKHPRVKIKDLLLAEIEKTDTITKEAFDTFLDKHKKNKTISIDVYDSLKTISNILYFVGGASKNKLKVCYDEYFDNSIVKGIMESVVSNYDEILNKDYDPEKIVEVLKEINVLTDKNDVTLLKCDDIMELRFIKEFKKFAKRYCSKATNNKALEYLRGLKKPVSCIKTIKSIILSIFFTIVSTGISHIFKQEFFMDLLIGLFTFAISEIITILFIKFNFRVKFISKILDKIIGALSPDVLYLYKIQQKIISCKK